MNFSTIPKIKTLTFFFFAIFLCGCNNKNEGTLQIEFCHRVENAPLQLHQLIYENKAGNPYQVDEVKYFISKICLIDEQNRYIALAGVTENPHYVDISLPETMKLNINVEEGNYKGFAFIFGLDKEDNISHRFVNPPEANFAWPDILGGGYHYMQINGKWETPDNEIKTMNFHTGIGQLYEGNSMQITDIYQYVHNHFLVTIPHNFSVTKNETTSLNLVMNIENWFQNPNTYDHNYFGGSIMQNQEAQEMIKQNGCDVFTIE